jgi:hypothetical protein
MADPERMAGEPLQPLPEAIEDSDFRLWREASGWRNLTLSAIGLSSALILLPLLNTVPSETAKEANGCRPNSYTFAGQTGHGQVVGFLSTDQAARLMQETQRNSRLAINPDYIANTRALVHIDQSLEGSRYVYLVPKDMNVRIGDRVDVVGGHLDPSLPCHYIPNLIAGRG